MSGKNKNRIRGEGWRRERVVHITEPYVRNRRRRKLWAQNGNPLGKGQKCFRNA